MHAFTDWEKVRKSTKPGASQTFASPGQNASESLIQNAVSRAPAFAEFVVLPCGMTGKLLWNNCPLDVATIVAERVPEAIVAYRPLTEATTAPPSSLWEAIQISRSVVHISDEMISEDPDGSLPELAPRDRHVRRELADRIQMQGDKSPTGNALRAGLYQIHDDLQASHEQSQEVEGEGPLRLADYWHAVMHRREPDYSNAKYWFRRVGTHPVHQTLATAAADIFNRSCTSECHEWQRRLGQGNWDAMAFVDLCELASRSRSEDLKRIAEKLQWLEMVLLLKCCCEQLRNPE